MLRLSSGSSSGGHPALSQCSHPGPPACAGMSLERSLGSVAFAHLMLLLVVLGDAAYVFFSFVAAFGPARCDTLSLILSCTREASWHLLSVRDVGLVMLWGCLVASPAFFDPGEPHSTGWAGSGCGSARWGCPASSSASSSPTTPPAAPPTAASLGALGSAGVPALHAEWLHSMVSQGRIEEGLPLLGLAHSRC